MNNNSNNKKSALGKGLSALLENTDTDITSKVDFTGSPTIVGAIANIDVEKIEANPFQPRTDFDREALEELSGSIKEHGVIQPVTVRKLGYDKYQLISGERRLKASKMAGLKVIPAYIRIANDQAMLEMAIVENIQRENLNAIEIAISYKRLIDECSLTQEELSERVSKNRSTITNYLRLLKLPPEIQIGIRDGLLTMGHARALVSVDDIATQLSLYKQIINNELSVRQAEDMARHNGKKKTTVKTPEEPQSVDIKKIQDVLSSRFETKIDLKTNKSGKGKIVIPFDSYDDLSRVLEMLNY
ncbi:MAG: ParB/RepB/Spo0J family partition protein [Bacteroidia bacterium]